MNIQNHPNDPDSFGEFFKDIETLPEASPQLADAIFAQTRGVLTRRRWLRRGRTVLACLLFYAVGIGSGWLLKPVAPQIAGQNAPPAVTGDNQSTPLVEKRPDRPPHQTDQRDSMVTQNAGQPRPVVAVNPKVDVPVDAPPRTPTFVLKPGDSQFENFRRAGDHQLFERGNLRGAMGCYRRALTHATEQQLNVEFDRDSWMLMALKRSRLEERKHVRQKRA